MVKYGQTRLTPEEWPVVANVAKMPWVPAGGVAVVGGLGSLEGKTTRPVAPGAAADCEHVQPAGPSRVWVPSV